MLQKKRSLWRFSCDLKVVFCSATIQKEEESNATMNASSRSSPEIEMNVFVQVLFVLKAEDFNCDLKGGGAKRNGG